MDELQVPLGRHIPERATWDQLTPALTPGEFALADKFTSLDSPPQEVSGFAHVFNHDSRNAQHLKHAFWPMVGEKKLCTVHSFQGWEARYVVLMISERTAYAKVDNLLPRRPRSTSSAPYTWG